MNRLAGESSPYLRQHRDNPVDWYPWGYEARARAGAEDKPLFVSIGYSSCHWCHVMAHESFDDPETAAVMNRLFVNVKVDREERPDVDAVYMHAVQALTGRGGWPLSVFLTPDGHPFFGGTYFPPRDRAGLPSFRRVLEAVHDAWRQRRDEIVEQAAQLTAAVAAQLRPPEVPAGFDRSVLDRARERLAAEFDHRDGGFGAAPKFPPAMVLVFLAGAHVRDADPSTLEMLTTTLDAMAAGGIHDQIGGGFARYSTDDGWLVPHFEKMLYDNALLVRAYTAGWLLTGAPRYRRVVEDAIAYLRRDLADPEGGFYAAEDADSEGEEGRFYLWTPAEVEEVCGADAVEVERYFGVTPEGNFEGRSILHVVDRSEEPSAALRRARQALLERRATRARPGLDDQVLLGWNALAARALCEAGAAFGRDDWIGAARHDVEFLLAHLRRDDGRLLRVWHRAADGSTRSDARLLAYADDYAALLEALLSLAEHDDVAWLAEARAMAVDLVALFYDEQSGGFFMAGHDAEPLVVRAQDLLDAATPAANSLAASGLLRLAALTGEEDLAVPADAIIARLGEAMAAHPLAFGHLLGALERRVLPPIEIAVVGGPDRAETAALRREVEGRLIPASVSLVAPSGSDATPLLAGRAPLDGMPAAFVCERHACSAPVTDAVSLRRRIDEALAARRPAG